MPTELFYAVWNGERRKNFFIRFVQSIFCVHFTSLDFASKADVKKTFPRSSVVGIAKNGTFLVFNYNLFSHETAAKLYTD